MKDKKDKKNKIDGNRNPRVNGVGRRDLMKMGVGAGAVAVTQLLHAPSALGQDAGSQEVAVSAQFGTGSANGQIGVPGGPPYVTSHTPSRRTAKYGDFFNKSGRISGNGPMDETSRKIVSFASNFKADLSDKLVVDDLGTMFIDTLGSAIAGFETDSIRAGTRHARLCPGGEMKSTVWGYGTITTPDMAAFVNSCAVRHFDNNSAGMHETDQIPGILAIGEALHSSGPDVVNAIVLFWEVFAALLTAKYPDGAPGDRGVWGILDNHDHAPATAAAVGKLLGLDEDRMANAVSLSFVDHLAMGIDHSEEPDSMSKSNHDAELCRAGVFAALAAHCGLTGPASPFEGVKGLMDVMTGPFTLTIPCRRRNNVAGQPTIPLKPNENEYVCQSLSYKRYPGNGGVPVSQIIPDFRKFCKVEDIESVDMEVANWGDGSGPGKFDPQNDDTADHSSQYCLARLLMHGDLFIDMYTKEKLNEPAVRQLMAKITQREVADGGETVTIRTKSGQTLTLKSPSYKTKMTLEEVNRKFDRHCAYRNVSNSQRDQIRNEWSDLRKVKDISVLIQNTLAHYGKPQPL